MTNLSWTSEKKNLSADGVYDLLSRHQLLPMDVVHAAALCKAVADCDHFAVNDDSETVADVFVGPVFDGDSAVMDLIVKTDRFRGSWENHFPGSMTEILETLFEDRKVRRVTAYVPYSRSRTKRALCSLGFVHEGRIRDGVHLYGQDKPEDLRVLGLLREDYNGN